MSDILNQLHQVLEQRKGAAPDSSYVASLYDKGLNKILEKVGEEAVETLLAARDTDAGGDPKALINETADLWFHSLIMLAHLGLGPITSVEYLDILWPDGSKERFDALETNRVHTIRQGEGRAE